MNEPTERDAEQADRSEVGVHGAEPTNAVTAIAVDDAAVEMTSVDILPPDAPIVAKKSRGSSAAEWGILLVGALTIALLMRAFLFQAFYIPSESMFPTLHVNDRIIVNKLAYKAHSVHRGDIVVFDAPPEFADREIKDLVKRVVGLEGETVTLKGGQVYIDDKRLVEPYLPDGTQTTPLNGTAEWVIPDNEVLVMGDNRGSSSDGRFFGTIPESTIVGRAFIRIWPISRFGFL